MLFMYELPATEIPENRRKHFFAFIGILFPSSLDNMEVLGIWQIKEKNYFYLRVKIKKYTF